MNLTELIDDKVIAVVKEYVDYLLEYNTRVNLISRQAERADVEQLIVESFLLEKHITGSTVVDAGSGNGLVGIPIALMNEKRRVHLVEPRKKKSIFLRDLIKHLDLHHVTVFEMSIEEYLRKQGGGKLSLVARGFPDLSVFCSFLKRKWIAEAVMVTSDNKIEINKAQLSLVAKKKYKIPSRDYLKILKITPMEKSNSGN